MFTCTLFMSHLCSVSPLALFSVRGSQITTSDPAVLPPSHSIASLRKQFQQLLKPEKAPSSSLTPPAENAEVAAKDGGFEPVTTRVSPAGEGVRELKKGTGQPSERGRCSLDEY